jgi:hypothetical protein
MSMDDYGNLIQEAAPYAPMAMKVGHQISRNQHFIQGSIDSAQGAWLGADVARMAGGRGAIAAVGRSAATRAAGGAIARTAASTAARVGIGTAARVGVGAAAAAASGAASGAAAGSVVPGVGTAIGAVAGAVAPLILPHIPVVGDVVNKIPVVGGILSPDKKREKKETRFVDDLPPSPFLQSGPQYALENRAEYVAGRGFQRS